MVATQICFISSPILGENFNFDSFQMGWLKPPTRNRHYSLPWDSCHPRNRCMAWHGCHKACKEDPVSWCQVRLAGACRRDSMVVPEFCWQLLVGGTWKLWSHHLGLLRGRRTPRSQRGLAFDGDLEAFFGLAWCTTRRLSELCNWVIYLYIYIYDTARMCWDVKAEILSSCVVDNLPTF